MGVQRTRGADGDGDENNAVRCRLSSPVPRLMSTSELVFTDGDENKGARWRGSADALRRGLFACRAINSRLMSASERVFTISATTLGGILGNETLIANIRFRSDASIEAKAARLSARFVVCEKAAARRARTRARCGYFGVANGIATTRTRAGGDYIKTSTFTLVFSDGSFALLTVQLNPMGFTKRIIPIIRTHPQAVEQAREWVHLQRHRAETDTNIVTCSSSDLKLKFVFFIL